MSFGSTLALALALGFSAALLGGCSRSSDGTVVIPKTVDSRRFWQDDEARRAAAERQQASAFPAGPEIRFATQQPGPRPVTRAPSRAADTGNTKPIACRAASGPTGRVKYICE
ncbi:hypothetical protein HNQ96_001150 [Aminobacter lissarensis]|uniref:Lipoprotein n=1 Tax=Aminobacter carboxidus TaxID=376165 RepID=A0A8E1WBP0_9HYPH|nr:hypothetical protein [Aminobacter lissarensis]MBB6465303.1 hypothetical protein [Aminobacter lissarensis]